jgi:hypothetical protein
MPPDNCDDAILTRGPKTFHIQNICALWRPSSPLSQSFFGSRCPRPWGVKFHGYRAQNAVVPGHQRSWVIGSAPVVVLPLPPGHRSPPQTYVSPVGPSRPRCRPPRRPTHVPLFPAQNPNPETGTPSPLVLRPGPDPNLKNY